MKFTFKDTKIEGLKIGKRSNYINNVGSFERLYCKNEFHDVGLDSEIVQINRNITIHAGTLRGLHFQISPYAEDKVITCIKGKVYDVALDLRKGSPTFLNWHGEILSDTNNQSMFIPKGFAHGFLTLSNNCEMLYFHSEFYSQEYERGILYNDPKLNIEWPEEVINLSDKDKKHEPLSKNFDGIVI